MSWSTTDLEHLRMDFVAIAREPDVSMSGGSFYALRGTSPLADSPWPKFQHDLRNTGRVGGR